MTIVGGDIDGVSSSDGSALKLESSPGVVEGSNISVDTSSTIYNVVFVTL